MKILSSLARLVSGSAAVAWVKGEIDKSIDKAAEKIARKYGDVAVQLCRDVDASLSNPAKLFAVATDLRAVVAKDGPTAPFGAAVIVAERAYAQIKADALTEARAFLAVAD